MRGPRSVRQCGDPRRRRGLLSMVSSWASVLGTAATVCVLVALPRVEAVPQPMANRAAGGYTSVQYVGCVYVRPATALVRGEKTAPIFIVR